MAPNLNAAQTLHAAVVQQAQVEHELNIHGITAPWIVALSMIVVFVIIWRAGGLKALTGGLDKKIATIRQQLDEAQALRAEAEAMRADLQRKAAEAHKEAENIIAHAKTEAEQLVAQAKIDADTLIARRGKMAEDKIAAAERTAIAEVRAKAASASAAAAAQIIAEKHDAASDRTLINQTISGLN